jgi:TatD DNase family protein
MLIDTHCHFDVEEFDADRDAVAARTLAAGVDTVVVPGYVAGHWPRLFEVCARYPQPRLLPVPGLHPCYVEAHREADLAELERLLAAHPAVVAVGEIGLDWFVAGGRDEALRRRQEDIFRAQLRIAARAGKPVLLHEVLGDTVVPNSATERLIAAGALMKANAAGSWPPDSYVAFTAGTHASLLVPSPAAVTVEMQREFVGFAVANGAGFAVTDASSVQREADRGPPRGRPSVAATTRRFAYLPPDARNFAISAASASLSVSFFFLCLTVPATMPLIVFSRSAALRSA